MTHAEAAGFVDGLGGDRPERGLSLESLWVPSDIAVDGDYLTWTLFGKRPTRLRRAGPAVLSEFVGLGRDPSAADIVGFARRWGVLGICRHGLPSTHLPGCQPTPRKRLPRRSSARQPAALPAEEPLAGREPLDAWRTFASQAAATLSFAAKLHDGSPVAAADYEWLESGARSQQGVVDMGVGGGLVVLPTPSFPPGEQPRARALVAAVVQQWLLLGSVVPRFSWSEVGRFSLASASAEKPTLFGVLASQLMFAVAQSDRQALCSGCARLYFRPVRRPKAGQRNYCPDCGKRAADRDAQRSRAQRLRDHNETRGV
jgi:hypothetical protein